MPQVGTNYTGQGVNGTDSVIANNGVQSISNAWIPNVLNTVHTNILAASKSKRWITDLAVVEDNFYGDIVQQYRAAFPRAFKFDAENKPAFDSVWHPVFNVSTTQYNWQRMYGVDIDESEITKITSNSSQVKEITSNNLQEAINEANLDELSLLTSGIENTIDTVLECDQEDIFMELASIVSKHSGYVINNSFVASNEVVIMISYDDAAKLKSLPALRYIDRSTRDSVISKFVEVPFIPETWVTNKEVTVTADMVNNNALLMPFNIGDKLPKGTVIINVEYFNPADVESTLLSTTGKRPNILVYDKRNAFLGMRSYSGNWKGIEGEDILFHTQPLLRGLVYQHSLVRSMAASFSDLFMANALRFDYIRK